MPKVGWLRAMSLPVHDEKVEQYYIDLERRLQIRVEKWIEKLTLTGFNSVWKKHRNAYVRCC